MQYPHQHGKFAKNLQRETCTQACDNGLERGSHRHRGDGNSRKLARPSDAHTIPYPTAKHREMNLCYIVFFFILHRIKAEKENFMHASKQARGANQKKKKKKND